MSAGDLALTRANAALATGTSAKALATAQQPVWSATSTRYVFPTLFGAVGDGATDCAAAIKNAMDAAATAASTSASAQFCEVVLPPGVFRTTAPIVVENSLTSVQFRFRGAGRKSTTILADFYTTDAAPQILVSGPGTGALLYPIIEFGQIKAVIVIKGGTGYTSATFTVVTTVNGVQVGTGAVLTGTFSGGSITAVSVTNPGSGYPSNYAGDVLVVRGQSIDISDLSITSSSARQAASNGGTTAYPYFTTNNGIRYEPYTGAASGILNTFAQTQALNTIERVNVTKQPGHGINAARQEQWRVSQVNTNSNGSDGLFLHTQGGTPGSYGISNAITHLRASSNGCRGLHVEGMQESSYTDFSIFTNLTASSLPSGVNEEILFNQCHAQRVFGDAEQNTGTATGHDVMKFAGCYAPQVGGYFRGGRNAIYLASCRAARIDQVTHYGNPSETSNAAVMYDSATGGTGDAKWAPTLGQIYLLGNVSLTVSKDNASIYANGIEDGMLRFVAMRGSQFTSTQSGASNFTPDVTNNGSDQVITLTGNVTVNAPASSYNGLQLRLTFAQDATGGRSLTFNSITYPGIGTIAGGTASQIGILDLQCVIVGARTVWIRKSWSGWL